MWTVFSTRHILNTPGLDGDVNMLAKRVFPIKLLPAIAAMALLVFLAGCSSQPQPEQVINDAHRFTTVSRVAPEFRPTMHQRLIWYGDLIVEDQQSGTKITTENRQFITQILEQQLRLRNYRFTQDPENADYVVGAALLLDDSPESRNIENFLQLHPMVGPAQGGYPTGTLMVAILSPGEVNQQSVLWRGAIQAFDMGERLPSEINRVRIEEFISRLIDSVPLAK